MWLKIAETLVGPYCYLAVLPSSNLLDSDRILEPNFSGPDGAMGPLCVCLCL